MSDPGSGIEHPGSEFVDSRPAVMPFRWNGEPATRGRANGRGGSGARPEPTVSPVLSRQIVGAMAQPAPADLERGKSGWEKVNTKLRDSGLGSECRNFPVPIPQSRS